MYVLKSTAKKKSLLISLSLYKSFKVAHERFCTTLQEYISKNKILIFLLFCTHIFK